jgi:3D (Asp-Asp-Asp) domain-containing protein
MNTLGALIGLFLLASSPRALAEPAPVAPVLPSYSVMMTAYNAVPGQTDEDPFTTASGAYSNPQIIAARSRDLAQELPFGTIIEFDGSNIEESRTCGYNQVSQHIGYRVIADTMNAKFTDRIDVLFGTENRYTKWDGSAINAANVLGICKGVTVRVVGFVDINHVPDTQEELAEIVNAGRVN